MMSGSDLLIRLGTCDTVAVARGSQSRERADQSCG